METAVNEKEKGHGHGREFEVVVIYNGVKKELDVRRGEVVKQLLDRAVAAFAPLPQPHLISLFTEAGVELQDNQVVDQVVRPGAKLLLRPSAVKGG